MIYEGYKIEHVGTYAMYQIKRTGSGPVPNFLKGLYSSAELARKQIDSYLRIKGEGSKNAKASSSGSD